jgi:hypothetical protein
VGEKAAAGLRLMRGRGELDRKGPEVSRAGTGDAAGGEPRARLRLGLLGLSPRNFDLLPALYRDPGSEIRWVCSDNPEDPLARLAEMLAFPLVRDPAAGEAVDLVIVPGTFDPSAHTALPGAPREIAESDLRRLLRDEAFAWEELGAAGRRRAPGE